MVIGGQGRHTSAPGRDAVGAPRVAAGARGPPGGRGASPREVPAAASVSGMQEARPRTSLSKLGADSIHLFIRVYTQNPSV